MPGSTFTFYEGTAPGIGKPVTPGTVANASALVTGLTNGTTYYFWLAVGQASTAVSNTTVATPEALQKVRTYKFCLAAVAGDSQVNLTWIPSAPGNNFTIYDGTAPGIGKPVKPDTVTDSGALVTGLTNGTTYYFWLTVGRAATAVTNTTSATPVTVPGAPTGLTATAGNAQVTLSWTAPASDWRFAGQLHHLQGDQPRRRDRHSGQRLGGHRHRLHRAGLTNGTTYYFKVVAINAAGPGPPSGEASATPVTVPGAPAGLTATPGNGQVTLSWAAPASDWQLASHWLRHLYGDHSRFQRQGSAHQGDRHRCYGDRPGQRDHLLLQGDRRQPGRRGSGGEGEGRPGDRAGGARRADRDPG